jgi:hypothetical protein
MLLSPLLVRRSELHPDPVHEVEDLADEDRELLPGIAVDPLLVLRIR